MVDELLLSEKDQLQYIIPPVITVCWSVLFTAISVWRHGHLLKIDYWSSQQCKTLDSENSHWMDLSSLNSLLKTLFISVIDCTHLRSVESMTNKGRCSKTLTSHRTTFSQSPTVSVGVSELDYIMLDIHQYRSRSPLKSEIVTCFCHKNYCTGVVVYALVGLYEIKRTPYDRHSQWQLRFLLWHNFFTTFRNDRKKTKWKI